jgi:hypothetical protein
MRIFLTICLLSLATQPLAAQQKHRTGAAKSASKKAKAFPRLVTTLGNMPGDSVPPPLMRQLLDSSLRARDQYRQAYEVTGFDFGYRKQEVSFNDSTGMPELVQIYTGFSFESDHLDSLWNARMKAEVQPGDELFFDHIIAENAKGEKYFSTPLHFVVTEDSTRSVRKQAVK